MTREDLDQHVTILGWLHLVYNVFFLAVGGFVFFLLTGVGAASGDPQAAQILGIVGVAVGGLLIVLGLPGMLVGYALLTRKPWARILGIVLGVFALLNFPIGTAVGAYTLWVLLQSEATAYFAPHQSLPSPA